MSRAVRSQRKKQHKQRRSSSLDAPLSLLNDAQVLTFFDWCRLSQISERTGRRILNGPDGPSVTMLSARRIGVTVRANRQWQQSRERPPGGRGMSAANRMPMPSLQERAVMACLLPYANVGRKKPRTIYRPFAQRGRRDDQARSQAH